MATQKLPELMGHKLLLLQPLDHELAPKDEPVIAVDTVDAGTGDLVYWVSGTEASFALGSEPLCVEAAVTGIVESVNT